MPVYPTNLTPAQTRHFRVEIEGWNPIAVQQANIPKMEHDSVEVSNGQSMVKFPGLTKVGDITLKSFINALATDDERLQWFFVNGDPEQGVASAPYDKRDGTITLVSPAGDDITTWEIKGAWIKAVDGYNFDKSKSEVLLEDVTLSVDSCKPIFG